MTLRQWCKNADIWPTTPSGATGAVSVVVAHNTPDYQGLWRLDDYKVDGLFGHVAWLSPRLPEPDPVPEPVPDTPVDSAEDEVSRLKKEIADMRLDAIVQQEKIRSLVESSKKATRLYAELQEMLGSMKESRDHYRDFTAQLMHQNQCHKQDAVKQEAGCVSYRATISELREHVQHDSEDIATLVDQIETLKSAYSNLVRANRCDEGVEQS